MNVICNCGHDQAAHNLEARTCAGRLETIADGDYAAWLIRTGSDPNEPCVCVKWEPE